MALKIGELYSVLQLDDKAYNRGIDKAGDSLNKLGGTAGKVGKAIAVSFAAAGTAIAAGLGISVKAAASFEQSLADVKSVMDPADIAKYGDQLKSLALTMGQDTKYSATEAAMGIEELVKAGVSMDAIMQGGLKSALDLATAGGLELAEAAEIASTALNAFSADALTVEDAANILAGAANASATSVGELKYGLSMSASVASAVGLSFKDTATALAVFAQNGLKGSDAGTSLKTMFLNLQPATNDQYAAFKKLNLITKEGESAFFDANGEIKSLAEISQLLTDGMGGMTKAQRLATMETMFGSDAIRAANILFKEGADGVNKMAEAMSSVTAAEVAAVRMDTFQGAIEEVKGALETLMILIGDPLLKPLTELAKKVDTVISALGQDVGEVGLKQALKNLIPPAVNQKIVEVKDVLDELRLIMARKDWTELGATIGKGLNDMIKGLGNTGKKIADYLLKQIADVDWAKVGKNAVAGTIGFILGFIEGLLDPMVWFKIVVDNWDVILMVLIGIIAAPAKWVAGIAKALAKIPFVGTFLSWLLKSVKEWGDKAVAPLTGFFKDMGQFFMDGLGKGVKMGNFFPALTSVLTKGKTAMKDFGTKMYVAAGEAAESLGKGIRSKWDKAVQWTKDLLTNIDIGLAMVVTNVKKFGGMIIEGLVDGIKQKIAFAEKAIEDVGDAIIGGVKHLFKIKSPSRLMREFGAYISEGLALGISDNQKLVAERTKLMAEAVKAKTKDAKESALKQIDELNAKMKPKSAIWTEAIIAASNQMREKLGLSMAIVKAQTDLLGEAMGGNAAQKAGALKKQLELLHQQLAIQKDTVKILEKTYKDLVKTKGATSKEAREAYLAWLQEQKAQQDLTAAIKATSKEMKSSASIIEASKQAVDKLGLSMAIAKARIDLLGDAMGGNIIQKTQNLKSQLELLYQQLAIQKDTVKVLEKTYKDLAKAKGASSKEAREAYLAWLQEQKAQKDLEAAIAATSDAMKSQSGALKDLSTQLKDVETKYRNDLKTAADDYAKKVEDVNTRLAASEKQLTDDYQKNLEARADSLKNFVGLFDAVTKKDVSGQQLLENLQGQVGAFQDWQVDIQTLAARGIDDGLLKELRDMGPKAAPEIAALLTLTDDQLTQYVALWQQRSAQAKAQATAEMADQKAIMENSIIALRVAAAQELEAYKQEWIDKQAAIKAEMQKSVTEITDKLKELAKNMPHLGGQIMDGLINGLEGKYQALQDVIGKIQRAVDSVANASVKAPEPPKTTSTTAKPPSTGGGGGGGGKPTVAAMAGGGQVMQGGLSWVGERGPELRYMPKGAQVIPLDRLGPFNGLAKSLEGIIANVKTQPATAGGGPSIIVNVYDNEFRDGAEAGDKIYDALRRLGI